MDTLLQMNLVLGIINILALSTVIYFISLDEQYLKTLHSPALHSIRKKHRKTYALLGVRAEKNPTFKKIEYLLNIFHMGVKYDITKLTK